MSGGEVVVCTRDTPFMVRDGTYRDAGELRFNDSVMPLYRRWQARDGYESVSTGRRDSEQTHLLVYRALHGELPAGHVVHRRNHVHFDNDPANLVALEAGAHSRYHRDVRPIFDNTDPEFTKRRIEGIRRAAADPDAQLRMARVGTANIKRYMSERSEQFAAAVAGSGKRGAEFLVRFNTSPRPCPECGATLPNPAALRWHRLRDCPMFSNHKIVAVVSLGDSGELYSLEVERHHNLALAVGVFVGDGQTRSR